MDNKVEQFQKLMEQILNNFQENQDKDATVIVEESLQEMGVSETAREKALEAGKIIDKIQEKSAELEEAKKKGSRERWLTREIARLTQKAKTDEEQQEILGAFGKTFDKRFEEELKNAE